MKHITINTQKNKEKAIIVGIELQNQLNKTPFLETLMELKSLANTAGLEIVSETTQKLKHPNPSTFIGSGKLEEIIALSTETQADIVLFDEELSPRHIRDLEEACGPNLKILDRTALILDIFAQHAATKEGALQVELAQYEYRLPRLTRAWTHLARQAGGGVGRSGKAGGVGLRGPGETQLEVDRREITRRISHLKLELEKVRNHRQQYRIRRKKSNIPTIALVGYTNAGKSTLINTLTKANVYVADQLFATLDPTTRRLELPGGYLALLTDTVGFIQKLPTMLIAAFRATLEEIAEADLLLHVVDITQTNVKSQVDSVIDTLHEIKADHIPIITALNKIDLLHQPESVQANIEFFPNSVAISAKTGEGIPKLLNVLGNHLFEKFTSILVQIPNKDASLINIFKSQGQVELIEYQPSFVKIQGLLPGRLIAQFMPYRI